ncbi:secreted RxLR effector protein 78-like [Apium graveolens]|uniref:secreted RxLR effector protein 78-like n=1 Tax=Apium graveolens TaxID=4045 RepID=UPI003D79633C
MMERPFVKVEIWVALKESDPSKAPGPDGLNAVIHAMKIHRVDGLIIKVDFPKAYDSVDWACLKQVLQCMNFGTKWINWIDALLLSTIMPILVNGSPLEDFSPIRGLRQGDPLAPYLFVFLVGEVLNR